MKKIALLIGLLACLTHLHAQEWIRQHPVELLVQLQDVEMDPSGLGFAVGDQETILRTADLGATWETLDAPIAGSGLEVALTSGTNGQQVWIGLNGSQVAYSANGGTDWEIFQIGAPASAVALLSTPSGNTVFAGSQTWIYKTIDGGTTWTNISPQTGLNWSSLFFLDASTGWAGASSGEVFHTTDGGTTWTEPSQGQFSEKVQIHFIDATHGYAAAFKSFFETTNGGQSWQLLTGSAFAFHVEEFDLLDEDRFVATSGNSVYFSADGGLQWERFVPFPYAYQNRGICGLPDGQVWVAGSHTMLGHSTDGGESYADQIPGNKNTLETIDFVGLQTGWAGGANGTILRTVDHGQSWEDVSFLGNRSWAGRAVSADEYWACAGDTIFRTVDGGQSWQVLFGGDGGNTGDFTDLAEVDGKVYVSNYNGKVYRTTDDGATWEGLPTQHDDWLLGVHFPDANTGYAVGLDSTILKTTDGGDSWVRLTAPTDKHIGRAYFLDAEHGWIMSSVTSNEIYYTSDGGQSWETVSLPVAGFWKNMRFADPNTGYLVGGLASEGRVLATVDGGQNWELSYTTYGLLNDLSWRQDATGYRLWIAGFGGNIELMEEVEVSTPEAPAIEELSIFPNPTTGNLRVQLPADLSQKAVIRIFDALGRQIFTIAAVAELDLNGLPAGWYTLRLEDGRQARQTSVLIER
ncbi:MAG: T9SS type A sorting domain-containing protein [Saprospiraceae bacterium]|nr:T9SS type A sorting domain-containing protein [Saprospiraceae bacterium]